MKGFLTSKPIMPVYWKPIITLLLLTPIVTEVLTNNIPFYILIQPKLFLTLAILLYGPTLLLRELAVRWNVRLAGYILLGLAYGIYNEGLFGKTFFNPKIANTSFINYGTLWHINLSWAAVMAVFHAFYAFLFPLLIVYNIFPRAAGVPWINKKWWIGISIACFLYISYKFLKNTWPVTPLHFVALVTIMAILILLSRCFKGGLTIAMQKPQLWLIAYGIIFVGTTFTVSDILARSRINILYFLAFAVINLLVAVMLLDKRYGIRILIIFCLAAQFGFATSVILVSVITKSKTGIITGSVFALIFASALFKAVKRANVKLSEHK